MDKTTIKYILRYKKKNLDEEDIANILELDVDDVKKVISISDTLTRVQANRKAKKYNSVKIENKTITKIPKKENIADKKISYYEEERKKETLIHDYNSYKKNAISEIKRKTDVILYRNNFFKKAKELEKTGESLPLEDIKVLADCVSTVPDLFKSYNAGFVIRCYEKYDAKDMIVDFIDDCNENYNQYGNDNYINDLIEKYGRLSEKEKEEKKQRKIDKEKEWKEEQRRTREKLIVVKKREKERKKDVTQNNSIKEDNSETKPNSLKRKQKKSLYEYFDDCTKEEIDKILPTLTDRQKEILNKCFDKDFNRNNIPQKPGEIRDLVLGIKNRIESKNAPKKTLYELCDGYTKEEIDNVLPTLTEKQNEILNKYFNKDLSRNNISEKTIRIGNLITAIKVRIDKNKKIGNKNTLYDYLDEYSKEEINNVLPILSNKQKEWLNTYFDEKFNRYDIHQKPWKIRGLINAIKKKIEKQKSNLTKKNDKKKKEKVIKVKEEKRRKKNTLYDYLDGYSKEEINSVLPTLTDKQKEWLSTYFDENFNRNNVPQKPGEVKELIKAIKARIEKKKKPKKEDKNKKKRIKKGFYEYFEDYTKDEIDKVLPTLTEKQKEILNRYFDKDLNRNNVSQKPGEIGGVVIAIKLRIEKLKNPKPEDKNENKRKKKGIYEYFEDYTKDEIDKVLPTLTDKQKEILNRYFDKDLNRNNVSQKPGEIKDLVNAIKTRINRNRKKSNACRSKGKGNYNNYNDICENFSEFPREQVISVANNLTKKAKIYRETYYDENLIRNEVPVEYSTQLQNLYTAIYLRLVPPIERNKSINKPTKNENIDNTIEILETDNSNDKIIEKKNFTEYFSDYDISFNIINKLIEVDKDRQKFIYKYFDKNLNIINNIISEEDYTYLNQIISHIKDLAEFEKKVREAKLQNKLGSLNEYDCEVQKESTTQSIADNNNFSVSNEDLINIYQMFKTGHFLTFLKQKSEIEIKVIKMKLGYQDEKYFPSKYISEELNITEDEAIRIYKNIIKEYKEILFKEIEKERQKNKKRMLIYEQEHDKAKQE